MVLNKLLPHSLRVCTCDDFLIISVFIKNREIKQLLKTVTVVGENMLLTCSYNWVYYTFWEIHWMNIVFKFINSYSGKNVFIIYINSLSKHDLCLHCFLILLFYSFLFIFWAFLKGHHFHFLVGFSAASRVTSASAWVSDATHLWALPF